MISQLTGGAATSLGQMGSSLLNTGLQGTTSAFGEANVMQQQSADKWANIFGSAGLFGGTLANKLLTPSGSSSSYTPPGGWPEYA